MKKIFTIIILLSTIIPAPAQQEVKRPKLVVGLVMDQMRWDYLYRYYNRYERNRRVSKNAK
ncbi:MAG: hypothetical protein IPK57_12340 [Chitinophagaceae bacterium]|nr:hypothetical protein [Chitinophagaceae bacterium]